MWCYYFMMRLYVFFQKSPFFFFFFFFLIAHISWKESAVVVKICLFFLLKKKNFVFDAVLVVFQPVSKIALWCLNMGFDFFLILLYVPENRYVYRKKQWKTRRGVVLVYFYGFVVFWCFLWFLFIFEKKMKKSLYKMMYFFFFFKKKCMLASLACIKK